MKEKGSNLDIVTGILAMRANGSPTGMIHLEGRYSHSKSNGWSFNYIRVIHISQVQDTKARTKDPDDMLHDEIEKIDLNKTIIMLTDLLIKLTYF